jgi:hypothetical protein
MNRILICVAILSAILMLIGADTTHLLQLSILLFILFAAAHLMFRHRLPNRFWSNLLILILGPVIVACVILALLDALREWFASNSWFLSLLLTIVLIACVLYGLQWLHHRRNGQRNRVHIRSGEREFIIPFDNGPVRFQEDEFTSDDEQ